MLSGFSTESLDTLSTYTAHLERSYLDGMTPDEFDQATFFGEGTYPFFHIRGLADFWSGHPGMDLSHSITDMVIGAHNREQTATALILLGTPQQLSLYISLGKATTTSALLTGIIPGIQLHTVPVSDLIYQLEPHFQSKGLLSGLPSRKSPGTSNQSTHVDQRPASHHQTAINQSVSFQSSPLERVIRGMQGATWGYAVRAIPLPREEVAKARQATIDLLAQVTSESHVQMQGTEQKNLQVTAAETSSSTKSLSMETVNYRAQYLIRLLERQLQRLDQAIATGQWVVGSYFGASTREDAQRLGSLLAGSLGGADSQPEPLRMFLCRRGAARLQHFQTHCSSEELALLLQLPREEVPGYAIRDYVRFDTDFQSEGALQSPGHMMFPLGSILQQGRDTTNHYSLALDDLSKHALVVGVTGSGKTTTVMNLLDRVVEARKPFLVIEPAKTEYRSLQSVLSTKMPLRVYTLGNEQIAPFRLNPFEFETDDDPNHTALLSHIDVLKAVFNAAFILYAPMPYVLETALHEVYEDKGWELASGQNTRLPDWHDRHLYPIFPTLTDLYRKVDEIVNRLGYHDEIERNVKAGLKARIGSLRLGAKGLMLDSVRGIPMHALLASPTILELENIGSDEEKTFLMGLLLAKIYEYRRLQAASGAIPAGLQHLMVFEEAHRLLKNTSTSVDVESSNLRAQAIEVFTNMLSEVRAYGQGVLVAEQIPSKLAPDVLKNTNLKIAHRLIARDDRESIGQTMNLTADQITHLGILTPGLAAIYAEGADHAYLVSLPDYKKQLSHILDKHLKDSSPHYASVAPYQAIRDVSEYDVPTSPFGGPLAQAYQDVGKLLDTEQSQVFWATLFLRATFHPSKLPELLTERLQRMIENALPHLSPTQHKVIIRMVLVRGCAELLHERGAQAGWSYPLIDTMRRHLTRGLLTLLQEQRVASAEEELRQFAALYQVHRQREQGPFPGCRHCQAKCLYRLEAQRLLVNKDRKWVDDDLKSTRYATQAERYAAIAQAVKEGMGARWLGEYNSKAAELGYCAALLAVSRSGYTDDEQILIGDHLAPYLMQR